MDQHTTHKTEEGQEFNIIAAGDGGGNNGTEVTDIQFATHVVEGETLGFIEAQYGAGTDWVPKIQCEVYYP